MPVSNNIFISPPFVVLVDALMVKEEEDTLKHLVICLAAKWRQLYHQKCRYVQSRFATTMVRATPFCIRGSRVPAISIIIQRPQWEDGAGLNNYQQGKNGTSNNNNIHWL